MSVSSTFHSASPIYNWVEENSANGPTPGTNRSNFDKGSDTELTIEDLPVEYRQELKVQRWKMEKASMHGSVRCNELDIGPMRYRVIHL
jgi:hypothetical protein